ncbi:hypothetical protein ABPG72_014003 [Tetrahymena utriculariae]
MSPDSSPLTHAEHQLKLIQKMGICFVNYIKNFNSNCFKKMMSLFQINLPQELRDTSFLISLNTSQVYVTQMHQNIVSRFKGSIKCAENYQNSSGQTEILECIENNRLAHLKYASRQQYF